MKKLNLGCGQDIKKGWINNDLFNNKANDHHDLEKLPYPWKKIDHILIRHTLEHLTKPEEKIQAMKKCLKIGGTLTIIVPHSTNPFASHFDHKTFWNYYCFPKKSGGDIKLNHTFEGFQVLEKRLEFKHKKKGYWLINLIGTFCNPIFNTVRGSFYYEHTFLRYLFPCYEIQVTLKRIK